MQGSYVSPLLHIVSSSGGVTVAEQVSEQNWFPAVPAAAVILLACTYFAIKQRNWLVSLPGLLMMALAVIIVLNRAPSYRMTIDEGAKTVSWEGYKGEKLIEDRSIRATELNSANLDFSPAGRRIVLVKQDGTQIFPLGSSFYTNEPVQYVLVNDLQRLLRQPETSEGATR